MPLEIREIVIKAQLENAPSVSGKRRMSEVDVKELEKRIINRCLEKVQDFLDKQTER
ncbi:DUF5908 family protein [Flavilitoribacter nigricans]|uniref:DUF5908 family protein n=1 Tax=Flavilitoribacter nigricans TaxID=70997 RepID=UPI001475B286|nr:DUF5908 family protein [Flavilitoribacter nigricans]